MAKIYQRWQQQQTSMFFFQNSFHSYIFVCLESDPQKNWEKFGHIFFWFKLYLTKSTEVNTSPSFEFTP